jgi:aminopeptidase N
MRSDLDQMFVALDVPGPYSPAAEDAGKRALRLMVLSLLSELDGGAAAETLFKTADSAPSPAASAAAWRSS